jgi:hypothetical protein
MADPLSIALTDDTLQELRLRGESPYSLPIERDLQRYYEALRLARVTLRTRLQPAEIGLVLDGLNESLLREPYHVAWISKEPSLWPTTNGAWPILTLARRSRSYITSASRRHTAR